MTALDFTIRPASAADVDIIARHRAEMYRDIHGLDDAGCAVMFEESRRALEPLLRDGVYLGWFAAPAGDPGAVVAGVGIRLRDALPTVRKRDGVLHVTAARQGLIVNVYTEREWRRRGLAALLMRALLAEVTQLGLSSVVLHASADGRALYESLGFAATNEMRYEGSPSPDVHA